MEDILDISNCLKGALLKDAFLGFSKAAAFLSQDPLENVSNDFFCEACRFTMVVLLLLIIWLHYRPSSSKFATISESSHKKHFSLSLILLTPEILNCRLATSKEGVVLRRFFEIFEILGHSFLPKHFQKSIYNGVSSPVGCRLGSYKFMKRNLPYICLFLEKFQNSWCSYFKTPSWKHLWWSVVEI